MKELDQYVLLIHSRQGTCSKKIMVKTIICLLETHGVTLPMDILAQYHPQFIVITARGLRPRDAMSQWILPVRLRRRRRDMSFIQAATRPAPSATFPAIVILDFMAQLLLSLVLAAIGRGPLVAHFPLIMNLSNP